MTVAFSGKVWVFGDNLNTDAMYPAFAMKMDPPEAAKHIFYEVRPGWTSGSDRRARSPRCSASWASPDWSPRNSTRCSSATP